MRRNLLALTALLAACAPQPPAAPAPVLAQESLLPGSIGVLVRRAPAGLVVVELRPAGAAALAGVRAGDVLLRYNGAPVRDVRDFNRRVLDSPPGTLARLELLRGADARRVELRVRELDTMPRV
jgi:S1-C subfamily serine protease